MVSGLIGPQQGSKNFKCYFSFVNFVFFRYRTSVRYFALNVESNVKIPVSDMVNAQQFGMGVGVGVGVGNVGANAMGMPNSQQVLAQQQQQQQSIVMQQQMQQMQQQQLQLQQQQQAAMVQQNNQANVQATTPQTPVPPAQQPPPPPPQQQNKEFNTASLCRFGQETVQEIVSRTLELFQTLKVLQPPNGTVS